MRRHRRFCRPWIFQTIRTGCLAAGNNFPTAARVPFPNLAIVLTAQHFSASARIGITREKIRRGEATVRQTYYGVQTYRLRRNSASNPG